MNEAFFALPKERQQRIINAAMEVFAKNPYKRASTDDIAAKAGISKGLLFYYFHNKRQLYLHLFNHATLLVENSVMESINGGITDFFELLEYGASVKMELLEQSPAIMDFCLRAYYDRESEAAAPLAQLLQEKTGGMFQKYFTQVDFSKFRPEVDPAYILRMLTWMTDGYINEKQRANEPVIAEEVMKDFRIWSKQFKAMVYKNPEG